MMINNIDDTQWYKHTHWKLTPEALNMKQDWEFKWENTWLWYTVPKDASASDDTFICAGGANTGRDANTGGGANTSRGPSINPSGGRITLLTPQQSSSNSIHNPRMLDFTSPEI